MMYAGVSWDADGYEADVIDDVGRRVRPPVRFSRGEVSAVTSYLLSIGQPLVTVVDSTNGVLDGLLMAAGLHVCRADPWVLPDRPPLGSVPSIDLARVAQRTPSAVIRLELAKGTLTGREDEVVAGTSTSTAVLDHAWSAGRCLRHGARDRAEIALTFDDGPLRPHTEHVLDILERYGVRATFFCIGLHLGAHSDDIVRMRERGHAIGNHTWSHPFLPDLSLGQLTEQVNRTQDVITETSGGAVPTLFRPPYGSRTPEGMGWLAEMELTIVLWDVASFDWALRGSDSIARTVLDQARPGSIITLHDGGGNRSQTVAALPRIIEGLLDRDFCFVPVDELQPAGFAADPPHA